MEGKEEDQRGEEQALRITSGSAADFASQIGVTGWWFFLKIIQMASNTLL